MSLENWVCGFTNLFADGESKCAFFNHNRGENRLKSQRDKCIHAEDESEVIGCNPTDDIELGGRDHGLIGHPEADVSRIHNPKLLSHRHRNQKQAIDEGGDGEAHLAPAIPINLWSLQ